jgi:HK97 family phage portal protein
MESSQQRAERIQRLADARAQRRDAAPVAQESPVPLEIAPNRGDLNRTSTTFDPSLWPAMPSTGSAQSLLLIDGRQVSYAALFAQQPWVAAAVMRMLTWAVRVPLKAYRRTSDDSRERLRPGDHSLARALVSPWERGSQAQLTMSLLGPLLVHGNALTEVEQGRSGALRFSPQDWRYSQPIKAFRDSISGWTLRGDIGEVDRTVSIDQMLHTAWWSPLGPLGISPLQQLGVTLAIEDAAQRYQKATFRNGARPPSAVTASEAFLGLDKDVREALLTQLRADVNALYSGPENAGRPALLPPGLDWKPVGHTAVEAELVDQRRIAREEVAAVYQIPPPSLGQLDRATYSNIVELRQVAYTDGLGPPLVLIEQAINAQLIDALLQEDDVYVEYDFAGVLRGDRLKEIRALREAISSALMTPNEGRAVLNQPRSEQGGMDDFYLPQNNLQPVSGPAPARERTSLALPTQRRTRADDHEREAVA